MKEEFEQFKTKRLQKHFPKNIRTFYIFKNYKYYCFIYTIKEDKIVFAGTVWKNIMEKQSLEKRKIYATTLGRFNKKPFTITLTQNKDLNFYQFRRLEKHLIKFWHYMIVSKTNIADMEKFDNYFDIIFSEKITKFEEEKDIEDFKRQEIVQVLKNNKLSIGKCTEILFCSKLEECNVKIKFLNEVINYKQNEINSLIEAFEKLKQQNDQLTTILKYSGKTMQQQNHHNHSHQNNPNQQSLENFLKRQTQPMIDPNQPNFVNVNGKQQMFIPAKL